MDASGSRFPSWGDFIDERLSARAFTVAKEVAARLKDRGVLLAANEAARLQTGFPQTIYWEPYGIAQGDAGLAVACAYFDQCFPMRAGTGSGRTTSTSPRAPREVRRLCRSGCSQAWPGSHFRARAFSERRRYGTLLEALDLRLCGDVLTHAAALRGKHGVAVSEFDVISGLSGVAAYLLVSGGHPPGDVALHASSTASSRSPRRLTAFPLVYALPPAGRRRHGGPLTRRGT